MGKGCLWLLLPKPNRVVDVGMAPGADGIAHTMIFETDSEMQDALLELGTD